MSPAVRSHWTLAVLLALAASVLHTWPLATNPARLSLHYNADVLLNEWIISWIQHQLPRAPLQLFDANIFYPARKALAFSEPLIVPALLGYPVHLFGGSPVLVHNLLLLAGLVLTVLATYALVHRWTGSPAAALVAALAYTFNTHTLMRLEHLQAMHGYGLPLALLAADRVIDRGAWRDAAVLAVAMTAMAYTSGYLVVFGVLAVGVLVLARARTALRRASLRGLAAAGVSTGVLVLPLYLPYRQVAVEHGMRRPLESVTQFSATPDGYLASYSRLHHALWNAGAPREFPDAFFPGVVVLVLAALGVWLGLSRDGRQRSRASGMIALAIIGVVLSLGTRTPLYGWLYEYVPVVSSLRAAGRFGILFMLAMAVLAGFGLAGLTRQVRSQRAAVAVSAVALLLVTAEALRAPLTFTPYRGIPGPYGWLAKEPHVVLVEAPFHLPETIFLNAEYVFNSTAHWRPLMNGYSGYTPGTYREYVKTFWDFPDPRAVEAMRAAGATHLMLHPRQYSPYADETVAAALANPQLERMAVGRDGITLFRIR